MEASKSEKLDNYAYSNVSLESEKDLLNQRYISYSVIFEEMKQRAMGDKEKTLLPIIENLFEKPQSWGNISSIQQCMVGLMTEDEIDVDFEVRLIKAKGLLSTELMNYYVEKGKKASLNLKRELLERLIRDTQWYSKVLDLEKTYVSRTRVRTGILFLAAILAFFMVDQLTWLSDYFGWTEGYKKDAIITAVISGVLGTCFSMLIGLKRRLSLTTISDLRVIHRFDYILSRALIGFVSGLVLFYFFDSEILKAPLFPDFNHENTTQQFLDDKNMALLIVWCFISGFLEKLVPDLLFKAGKSFEAKASTAIDKKLDKFI